MNGTPAIRCRGLTKVYDGGRGILDLELEVHAGEIFGYLGPNGAGKTTTIRLLLDLIRPTRGSAELVGLEIRARSVEIRRRTGYLPGELALYEDLTGRELIAYFAALRRADTRRRSGELAERLDIDLDRRIRELSRGNKQKIGLIQALAHDPDLLVLDEPTAGLDPLVQQEVQALLRESAAAGGTVFLSSHVLAQVEQIADRVGIVRDGRLVAVEEVDTLKARAVRRLVFEFARPVPADAFRVLPGVRAVDAEGAWLRLEVEGPVDAVVKEAALHEVVNITSHEPDLEEIFLSYYRGPASAS